jgi:hypothetical protein
MLRQNIQLLNLTLICFILCGCATAVRGSAERVQINSVPEGAMAVSDSLAKRPQIYDDGSQHNFYGCAPTPCSINFSRKSAPVVEITKAGYAPIKFKIVSSWETGAGSLTPGAIVAGTENGSHVIAGQPDALRRIPIQGASLIGGVATLGAGPALDVITGASFSLSPNPVTAKLAPLPLSGNGARLTRPAE